MAKDMLKHVTDQFYGENPKIMQHKYSDRIGFAAAVNKALASRQSPVSIDTICVKL